MKDLRGYDSRETDANGSGKFYAGAVVAIMLAAAAAYTYSSGVWNAPSARVVASRDAAPQQPFVPTAVPSPPASNVVPSPTNGDLTPASSPSDAAVTTNKPVRTARKHTAPAAATPDASVPDVPAPVTPAAAPPSQPAPTSDAPAQPAPDSPPAPSPAP